MDEGAVGARMLRVDKCHIIAAEKRKEQMPMMLLGATHLKHYCSIATTREQEKNRPCTQISAPILDPMHW